MIYKGIDAMSKLHVKKGDTVYVNTGEDKGKTGRILEVLVKENRAVVEGINICWIQRVESLRVLVVKRWMGN